MTHDEIKLMLKNDLGKRIGISMSHLLYPFTTRGKDEWIKVENIWQFAIREQQYSSGTISYSKLFLPDALLIVFPGSGSNKNRLTFTVAIEIKTTETDLMKDEKTMSHYIGWTDYLILLVPQNLVNSALLKVKDNPLIGVVDTNNVWHRMPLHQQVSLANQRDVAFEALWKVIKQNNCI